MDLASAFKKIKIVEAEYKSLMPGNFNTQLSTSWLQTAIENYSDTAITIKLVDWNPVQIKGRIDRYVDPASKQSHADIIISSKLNYCWTRFVGVKEMCHLVIDTVDTSVKSSMASSAEHVQKLIGELISSVDSGSASKSEQYFSEVHAYYCAIELMFPIRQRLAAAQRLIDKDPNTSIHSLAVEYRMPKHYVELSLNPNYNNIISDLVFTAEKEVNEPVAALMQPA